MIALLDVVLLVLNLYQWVVIVAALFSWLYAFNVVNPRNAVVMAVANTLYRLTEPVLRPIRQILPSMGGMDLSPVVLLIGIYFIQRLIVTSVYPMLMGL
ncbi:YggT family protein [Pseudoxanthobacter sp.]|uniref:YggT family protein n=1 Tax=Pseudoxanthobacter sp. TaxID=1925742 RepID=UPI002FE30376